jgi:hypothetical protein
MTIIPVVVTLLGGHALGHVHKNNSGYGLTNISVQSPLGSPVMIDAWSKTPAVFDTSYYGNLFHTNWFNVKPNSPEKDLWKNEFLTIMLNVDMALAFSIEQDANNVGVLNQVCGPAVTFESSGLIDFGCDRPLNRAGASTLPQVRRYDENNTAFYADFEIAYVKMVTVGYGVPANTDGATASGKLGTLTSIDLNTCAEFLEDFGIVDYSCLHENAWHIASEYSNLFNSNTGVQSSAFGDYVPVSTDDAKPPPPTFAPSVLKVKPSPPPTLAKPSPLLTFAKLSPKSKASAASASAQMIQQKQKKKRSSSNGRKLQT